MRAGVFGEKRYRCNECKKNPNNKLVWGCESKSKMSEPTFVDDGTDLIFSFKNRSRNMNYYCNCPVQWVVPKLWDFIEMFDTLKLFPSMRMPEYKDMSKRFIQASNYFESKINKYQIDLMKEK